jgi:uncharacterized protein (TIGR02186 family)
VSDRVEGRSLPFPRVAALLLCATSLALAAAPATGDESRARITVSPTHVAVTSQFHGSTLKVDVAAPPGTEIVLKLEGRRRDVVFNQKGRVLVVWMNVGEVTIGNAPQAYMLYTSAERGELASGDALRRLGLGLEALGPEIETRGEGMDRETMLREFYDYKRKSGLYRVAYGALRPQAGEAGRDGTGLEHYMVGIDLPSRVPVGDYEVDLYVFEDGEVVDTTSEAVTVEKTGFPLFVSRLARDHPGEYGLLAIVVAVVAGFLVGLVFSRARRRTR